MAGAVESATGTSHATLREVPDNRKLRFHVEVREGERTIGAGTACSTWHSTRPAAG